MIGDKLRINRTGLVVLDLAATYVALFLAYYLRFNVEVFPITKGIPPFAPYLAQILVNTRRAEDVVPLITDIRRRIDPVAPGARVVARQLEQGPPVDFPIQLRFAGPDLDILRGLAQRAAGILRQHAAYKVFDDLGQPRLARTAHPQTRSIGCGWLRRRAPIWLPGCFSGWR